MKSALLTLFPLPVRVGTEKETGASAISRSSKCTHCPRPCEAVGPAGAIETCFRGLNYQRIDDETVTSGFIVIDLPLSTAAHKDALKKSHASAVRMAFVKAAVESARRASATETADLAELQKREVNDYVDSEQFRRDAIADLQPHIKRAASSAHDLMNLAHTISANVKAILETLEPGVPTVEVAERHRHEGAIFFAAELMKARIETTLLLANPGLARQGSKRVRIHGLILKYLRIYNAHGDGRGIRLLLKGESFGEAYASPEALSVVVQALLDNAVKYSPHGNTVDVVISETADTIRIEVHSLGPRILPEERSRIFTEFFRGDAAAAMTPDGLGFGLAAAMVVSNELGLKLRCSQTEAAAEGMPAFFKTCFSFEVGRE